MHSIQIPKIIALIISFFYFIGLWHRGEKPTMKEIGLKLLYCSHYALFILSLVIGAIINEETDQSIFLTEESIGVGVLYLQLWLLIWKQSEILNLLNLVCVFSIRNDDDHNVFTEKVRGFIKFVFVFMTTATIAGSLVSVVFPLVGSEKSLFIEIAFPLDYKNNDIAFWIAAIWFFTETFLTMIVIDFSVIIWYLLLICARRYEILGSELKRMRRISENGKVTENQMQKHFFEDLKTSVGAHLYLRLINEVDSFFSDLFLIQFGTSGLCICGSIYCLAFDVGDNLLERYIHFFLFFYFISQLFMITYFGNEIMPSSDCLSYSLFESDWYTQPQATKKCIIIFGEYLKRPQEIVIVKLYPLTLETFTRILNSAYGMFNILKNFK